MAIVNTNRKSVNIEDVHIEVACPSCKTGFGISIKRPQQTKNCYCGAGMFEIETSARKGVIEVHVAFVWNNTRREPMEPDKIEILPE